MKISVVTVCLNAEATIGFTMASVLNQTYENIEYVIVDGKSQDNTINIIKSYEKDSRIKFISEADNGLYNAMNKAALLCSGEYVIYMNSGDIFCDDTVIEDMIPFLDSDLVYGNVIRIKKRGREEERYKNKHFLWFLLLTGRMMSHQSLFVKAGIIRRYMFDEGYKICADYDFVLRARKGKCSLRYIDRTISIVDNINGVSSQVKNNDIMREEDDRSLKNNFKYLYYFSKIMKEPVRFIRRIKENNENCVDQ